ncbi:hypothetical protein ACFSRY_02040 [Pontibacter locisalis]|uniref:PH domain-containing protein n=1 Tax=Pontibacter locisalis TaxID=1719035 RepID=A0ABW5II19_9BACT
MKVYKTAKGWAIFTYIVAPLLIALFSGLLVMPFIPGTELPLSIYWILTPVSLGMLALLIVGVLDTIKGRFVIDKDRVFVKTTLTNRQLMLDEIKGYRVDNNYIFIESAVPGKKRIKISAYLGKTDEILEWLSSSYPDLNLQNMEQEEQEILNNEELGWTYEQREEKLKKARKTAKVLSWIGGLVGAWTLFWPSPYEYAIVASVVVPVIAIIIAKTSGGLIRFDEKKNSAYPTVFWGIFSPSMAVSLRALLDFNIFNHDNVWLLAALISVTFIVVLIVGSKEFDFKSAKGFLAVAGISLTIFAYSYGTAIVINCLNDSSTPEIYSSKVLNKRISSGKSTSYYIELTPWGSQKEADEVSVTKEFYEQINKGDAVSIYFMKGYMEIPWFIVTN